MGANPKPTKSKQVKVKILCPLPGVYAKYQPEVGKIYDANYLPSGRRSNGAQSYSPVCIIKILDKRICLRTDEFEIVGE